MERSLIQLKSDFADMADKHKQINSFFWGNFVDAINQDAVDYPLMCCTLQPSQIGDSYTGVDLQVIICDKYNEQDYRMIDEVHSDMLRILKDIDVTLKQFRFQDYLDVETDFSTEPFINEGQDITAGWGGLVRMKVHDYENRCAIPYDGFDFDGSTTGTGCPAGTSNIYQSDGTTLIESVSIPSGDTVNTNIADSVITVNTDPYTDLPATDSLDIPVIDSIYGAPLETTVVGSNVEVTLLWYMVVVLAFQKRMEAEGATFENASQFNINLLGLTQAEFENSLASVFPNGYDTGVLYGFPLDGAADFTYTQNTSNG
jgi:hypothetical protein